MVLDTLMRGYPIHYNDYVFRMSEDFELCTEGYEYKNGQVKPWNGILLKTHVTLKDFIDMCEKVPEEDIFIVNANKVLNNLNRKY